jgi:hypothetical protein
MMVHCTRHGTRLPMALPVWLKMTAVFHMVSWCSGSRSRIGETITYPAVSAMRAGCKQGAKVQKKLRLHMNNGAHHVVLRSFAGAEVVGRAGERRRRELAPRVLLTCGKRKRHVPGFLETQHIHAFRGIGVGCEGKEEWSATI